MGRKFVDSTGVQKYEIQLLHILVIYYIHNNIIKAPVAGGCNTAIGGQGQLGCMWPVCSRSLSKLRISVHTMLKDASTLSWPGLVKQVLPSRDSCWLASAYGDIMSLSPGEGRMALQTIVLRRICSNSSCSSSRAARGSPCSRAASVAHSRRSSSNNSPSAAYKGPHIYICIL